MKKKTEEVTRRLLHMLEQRTCNAFVQAQGPTPLHIAYGILPKQGERPRVAILTLSTTVRATSYIVSVPEIATALRVQSRKGTLPDVAISCVERVGSELPERAMVDPDWMLAAPVAGSVANASLDVGDLCMLRGVWLADTVPS